MRFIVLLCLLISPALADDLDDNAAICAQNRPSKDGDGIIRTGRPSQWKLWKDGWEHCQLIYEQKIRRDAAARDADEAKNPDLKKTREFSKSLH